MSKKKGTSAAPGVVGPHMCVVEIAPEWNMRLDATMVHGCRVCGAYVRLVSPYEGADE